MLRRGWLAALVLLAGCANAGTSAGPDATARAFARAWTEGRCAAALRLVRSPDDDWRSSCRTTFTLGTTCDQVQPGDPPPVDCGPGTRIRVQKVEITERSGSSRLTLLVTYRQGRSTTESRTMRLGLTDGDGWRVTRVG